MPASYSVPVTVRWSDMDAYGHVNNVQLLRLLEDARVLGFRDWFGQDRSMLDDGVLVARHEIEYLRPLTFDYRDVHVHMWCSKISGASFDLAYEMCENPGDERGTVYVRAETTLVAYDFTTQAPRRLSEREREALGSVPGEPVALRRRRQEGTA